MNPYSNSNLVWHSLQRKVPFISCKTHPVCPSQRSDLCLFLQSCLFPLWKRSSMYSFTSCNSIWHHIETCLRCHVRYVHTPVLGSDWCVVALPAYEVLSLLRWSLDWFWSSIFWTVKLQLQDGSKWMLIRKNVWGNNAERLTVHSDTDGTRG